MRRSTIAAIATVSVIAFAQIASAADLPRKAPSYTPPPPVALYNWTGFYLGINGGYGWGNTTGNPFGLGGENLDINGALFGGQIGFNYQLPASPLVLGIEADWDWTGIKGSNSLAPVPGVTLNNNFKLDDLGTVRGRVGYVWDRALLYATGGWAWSHRATWDLTCTGPCLPAAATDSQSLSGYTVGGGVEYGFSPNLSVKAEYLYVHLAPAAYFGSQGCPAGNCDVGANVSLIRLGLNWRFSGLP
jgi:outer membrane immunogenic protein